MSRRSQFLLQKCSESIRVAEVLIAQLMSVPDSLKLRSQVGGLRRGRPETDHGSRSVKEKEHASLNRKLCERSMRLK